jgi:hypothetical protein
LPRAGDLRRNGSASRFEVEPFTNRGRAQNGRQSGRNGQGVAGIKSFFQASKSGAISDYQQIEEAINPAALEVVGEWLVKRTAAK